MLLTILVLDSVGVGALPDAARFGDPQQGGDAGSFTLNNTLRAAPVTLPNLAGLGLGAIPGVETNEATIPDVSGAAGAYGRMEEVSPGKDSSTGHWEFMGVQLENAFQVYPQGFPPEVMDRFDAATGRGHLCNLPYSGTEVLKDYGREHLETGDPIVYTSADSVFQVAAHVDKVPLEQLYAWCEAAREILQGEHAVARVIARPFAGESPFERLNDHRKDYSLVPPRTVLDALKEAGREVIGIGKIPDLYAGQGFTEMHHTDDNADGIRQTLARMHKAAQEGTEGLIFTNLVDFDSKFGHRRDPEGYSAALKAFDNALPEFLAAVPEDGALLIISDHGNDPSWYGSDHTREYGLLLGYRPGMSGLTDLGTRQTFADVGATAADALKAEWDGPGQSFWPELSGQ
ncbi:phosphopentomutase [Deinococcus radiophilus]|uniref:Phosphopentomutase n=1 Tax=Deinococcus radiophilus TaxID=32062 RepID=A0A3S0RK13_9DEIO|nr:phosphopentomutase [Deinococcus radiophilus]RTR30324.1 phosphopentomutase [Deinococcus radiophilus]UFA49877.1 phosphopentomutase [Deinococcus radiophilus]